MLFSKLCLCSYEQSQFNDSYYVSDFYRSLAWIATLWESHNKGQLNLYS